MRRVWTSKVHKVSTIPGQEARGQGQIEGGCGTQGRCHRSRYLVWNERGNPINDAQPQARWTTSGSQGTTAKSPSNVLQVRDHVHNRVQDLCKLPAQSLHRLPTRPVGLPSFHLPFYKSNIPQCKEEKIPRRLPRRRLLRRHHQTHQVRLPPVRQSLSSRPAPGLGRRQSSSSS